MKVSISIQALKAVSMFAAEKDVRYYLNGIHVEFNGDFVRVVATNGHILGVWRETENDEFQNEGSGSFIIPNENVKEIARWKFSKYAKNPIVTFSSDDGKEFRAMCADKGAIFHAIDGRFPDWRRVIPAQLEPEQEKDEDRAMAFCDPMYLQVCIDARRLLTGKKDAFPRLKFSGNINPVLADIHENMIGIVMPMRTDKLIIANSDFADWAREFMPAQTEPVATESLT